MSKSKSLPIDWLSDSQALTWSVLRQLQLGENRKIAATLWSHHNLDGVVAKEQQAAASIELAKLILSDQPLYAESIKEDSAFYGMEVLNRLLRLRMWYADIRFNYILAENGQLVRINNWAEPMASAVPVQDMRSYLHILRQLSGDGSYPESESKGDPRKHHSQPGSTDIAIGRTCLEDGVNGETLDEGAIKIHWERKLREMRRKQRILDLEVEEQFGEFQRKHEKEMVEAHILRDRIIKGLVNE